MCTLRQQECKGGNWYKAKVHLVIKSLEEEGDITDLTVMHYFSSVEEKTLISNFQEQLITQLFCE